MTTTPQEPWEDDFDNQFGKLILGTLSGDANSPVFTNNSLEVPRLKSFISSLLSAQRESDAQRINTEFDILHQNLRIGMGNSVRQGKDYVEAYDDGIMFCLREVEKQQTSAAALLRESKKEDKS